MDEKVETETFPDGAQVVAGIDRPGYWDEVKLIAGMAAQMYPFLDSNAGPEECVAIAREMLAATMKSIDEDLAGDDEDAPNVAPRAADENAS